jgi:N,N'-diacetyllegionaminate synthase
LERVLIIAEAGVNHNGDLEIAKELIRIASKAGADVVKFQTFKADSLVSREARKAAYQMTNLNDGNDSQYEMLKKLEIPEFWYTELLECCEENNIEFLSTGFDEESVDFLENLGQKMYKIPSGEITNLPYLQHVARKGKPVILSTGMADMSEVEAAVEVIIAEGLDKDKLTVLHCNTEYPTPYEDVNLRAMNHIWQQLSVRVGYSDHTLGIEVSIAAVALGACVIEKHFTLDRKLSGPDHAASLEPAELEQMVKSIRIVEKVTAGSGLKVPSESEKHNIRIARKSIHTSRDLLKGTTITGDDLIMLRPGDGISPMDMHSLIGKKLSRDLSALEKISVQDFL